MRILMAGAYGIQNVGDDTPLLVLWQQLPEAEFVVLIRHEDEWYHKLGVRQVSNIEHESSGVAAGRWFDGLNRGDDGVRLRAVTREIADADVLVIGAGNWMTDITLGLWRGPMVLNALYLLIAKEVGTPVFLYGIGIGPLMTSAGATLASWVLAAADMVTVRDRRSAEIARQLGRNDVVVAADACLGLRGRIGTKAGSAAIRAEEAIVWPYRARVAVGLRDLRRTMGPKTGAAAMQRIGDALRILADEKIQVIFIPQSVYSEDDDREASLVVGEVPGSVRLRKRYSGAELISLYGACDAVLGVRLHAVVFGVMAGRRTTALAYLPKVALFCEQVGGITCLAATASSTVIANNLRGDISRNEPPVFPRLRDQAREAGCYGALIRLVLGEGEQVS